MFISALLWCQFPETKGQPLSDRYSDEEGPAKLEKGHSNKAFDDFDVVEKVWEKELEVREETDVNFTHL